MIRSSSVLGSFAYFRLFHSLDTKLLCDTMLTKAWQIPGSTQTYAVQKSNNSHHVPNNEVQLSQGNFFPHEIWGDPEGSGNVTKHRGITRQDFHQHSSLVSSKWSVLSTTLTPSTWVPKQLLGCGRSRPYTGLVALVTGRQDIILHSYRSKDS